MAPPLASQAPPPTPHPRYRLPSCMVPIPLEIQLQDPGPYFQLPPPMPLCLSPPEPKGHSCPIATQASTVPTAALLYQDVHECQEPSAHAVPTLCHGCVGATPGPRWQGWPFSALLMTCPLRKQLSPLLAALFLVLGALPTRAGCQAQPRVQDSQVEGARTPAQGCSAHSLCPEEGWRPGQG